MRLGVVGLAAEGLVLCGPAVAHGGGDGARRLLMFDGSPLLDSAVCVAPEGLLIGVDAVRAGAGPFPEAAARRGPGAARRP
jgi:hypothetical protein